MSDDLREAIRKENEAFNQAERRKKVIIAIIFVVLLLFILPFVIPNE